MLGYVTEGNYCQNIDYICHIKISLLIQKSPQILHNIDMIGAKSLKGDTKPKGSVFCIHRKVDVKHR